jgi:hypothetical protein
MPSIHELYRDIEDPTHDINFVLYGIGFEGKKITPLWLM